MSLCEEVIREATVRASFSIQDSGLGNVRRVQAKITLVRIPTKDFPAGLWKYKRKSRFQDAILMAILLGKNQQPNDCVLLLI